MRRYLALMMGTLLFLPQAVMGSADGMAEPCAALDRFFNAVAASVSEDIARAQADSAGSGLRSLMALPTIEIASAATTTVQAYFPMQHGDSKSYTSSRYGGSVYQYDQTSKNGQVAWRETDSLDGSRAYYGYAGSSLVMYGADASGLNLNFDTPLTILKNSQITNGGTIESQTTLTLEGYRVKVSYIGTVKRVGTVTVPAGTFDDCIELSMNFSYTAEGESDSMELGDVWVLAPEVGKLKIVIADQFMNYLGWMELEHGTAGGKDITNLASFTPAGTVVTGSLWVGAVIKTEDKGPIEGVWQLGGEDTTARGDRVIWGYFYVDPNVMSWGNRDNPDLFVKIWIDVNGPIYVDYFHVSVPDIAVYTDFSYDGTPDQQGTATLTNRFVEHYQINGASGSHVQSENGLPPSGYAATGNPMATQLIYSLRIGAVINTEDMGPIDGVWRLGGQDTTSRGDQVVWGYFYADPNVMSWGSQDNPDLFVKIWFDVTGPVYVDFFHVSVPDIEVYSGVSGTGGYENSGTTILTNRFVEHAYDE